jgi:hypothetical protein
MPITYQARYRIPAQTTAWTTFGPTFSASPATITGLTAGTNYDFSVVSFNGAGSTASAPVSAQTVSSQTETVEAFSTSTLGVVIFASQQMNVPAPTGPWNQFQLANTGTGRDPQIQINTGGGFTTQVPTGFVSRLVYHNHTLWQVNTSNNWYYWNTNLAPNDYTQWFISAINLSATSFPPNSPSGTIIGAVSVTTSDGSTFNGTFSTDNANFTVTSGNLVTTVANLAGSFTVNITATPAVVGQPFTTPTPFTVTSTQESAEGFTVTTINAPVVFASTTTGSPDLPGPWLQFNLVNTGTGRDPQIALNGTTQTPTGFVSKLVYHNHTLWQVNTSNNWYYWNTALAPNDYTQWFISAINLSTSTYTANLPPVQNVATVNVVTSDTGVFQTFQGVLSLDAASQATFQLNGNVLQNKVTLSQSSYSITITATPSTVGQPFSATIPLSVQSTAGLVQAPLAMYVATFFGTAQSNYYTSWIQHWNGANQAMGRTATMTGCGLNSNSTDMGGTTSQPSSWPAQATNLSNSLKNLVGTGVVPEIAWVASFDDTGIGGGSGDIFSGLAAGTYDSFIQQSLQIWKNAGFSKVYIRLGWEFNLTVPAGVGNNHWQVTGSNVANWRAAWAHFANVAHTWANANAFTVRMVWNPSVYGGANESTNSLTLNAQFPNQVAGDNFVDVIGIDFYSPGGLLASTTDSVAFASRTRFMVPSLVAIAQQWNIPICFPEIGGLQWQSVGNPCTNTWMPDLANYLNSISSVTPIEYLALWDNSAGPIGIDGSIGTMEFTGSTIIGPSNSIMSSVLAGWRSCMGTGGNASIPAIMTIPVGGGGGTLTAPTIAANAGYHTLVWSTDFVNANEIATADGQGYGSTQKWFRGGNYPNYAGWTVQPTWHAQDIPLGQGAGSNASAAGGVLVLSGGTPTTSNSFITSIPRGTNSVPSGGAAQGIFNKVYIECYMAYDPNAYGGSRPLSTFWFPAFWSWTVEGYGSGFGPSAPGLTATSTEIDFFEDTSNVDFGGGPDPVGKNGHGGFFPGGGGAGTGFDGGSFATSNTQWHTIGFLWDQSNNITFYKDGVQSGGATAMSSVNGAFANQHIFIILGTGAGWPLYVDWVRVWGTP